jgi:6-phosphofructokinase 1
MVGASYKLMHMIERQYPGKYELRNVILGHTQRGGGPNAQDRILAKQFGIAAFEAYEQGKFGQVVSLRDGQITTVPLSKDVNNVKFITRDNPLYKAAQSLGVYVN